ncbi:hypothetical protein B296_00057555 [Ensete ventricosum]|uniref:Uncharacterized protein n=1 Tax=Ensete ventricosum TaxID=4639 RepID=A0A426XQQ5_ENSVE|nr:hypothetical protein B296_00057555 [Ensete ventricosum]
MESNGSGEWQVAGDGNRVDSIIVICDAFCNHWFLLPTVETFLLPVRGEETSPRTLNKKPVRGEKCRFLLPTVTEAYSPRKASPRLLLPAGDELGSLRESSAGSPSSPSYRSASGPVHQAIPIGIANLDFSNMLPSLPCTRSELPKKGQSSSQFMPGQVQAK